MRLSLVWLAVGLAFGAQPPVWGPAAGGLRLGLSLGPEGAERVLRASVQNVGDLRLSVLAGFVASDGPMYTIEFTGTAPDGKTCQVLNLGGGWANGYLEPIVISLAVGETHDLFLPMKRLVFVDRGRDRTLDELLDHGYSVQAKFQTAPAPNELNRPANVWIGSVLSGEFRPSAALARW